MPYRGTQYGVVWQWEQVGETAKAISVGPDAAYIVNSANRVRKYYNGAWSDLPAEEAKDVGVGAEGSVFILTLME